MKHHTVIIVLLLIFFSITALFIFSRNMPKNKLVEQNVIDNVVPTMIRTIDSNGAVISLERIPDNRKDYITVGVRIDSKIHKVSGFDVVLEYNPTDIVAEEFIQSQQDFEMFTDSRDGTYSIGGVRKLTVGKPVALKDEMIGSIVFKKNNQNKTEIRIMYIPQSMADSNVITDESKDVLVNVIGLSIDSNLP